MLYAAEGKLAQVPYLMEDAGLGIYSIEELAYFIHENIMMLDDTFMDYKLCAYIRDELEMPVLADKLAELIRKGRSLFEFVALLFREIGFASEREIGIMKKAMGIRDRLGAAEKHRLRGDFLMRYKRYASAVLEFDLALDCMSKEAKAETRAAILHSIGVAYARLFFFRQASEYFYKAYELYPRDESYFQYLAAVELSMKGDQFEVWCLQNGIEERWKQMFEERKKEALNSLALRPENRMKERCMKLYKEGSEEAYSQAMETLLLNIKNDYRFQVTR